MIEVKVTGVPAGLNVSFDSYAFPRTIEEFDRILEAAGGTPERVEHNSECVRVKVGDVYLRVEAPWEASKAENKPKPETAKARFIRERLEAESGNSA